MKDKKMTNLELNGLKIVMVCLSVIGLFILFILAFQVDTAINYHLYKFEDGNEFCEQNNMIYEVYFSGDKYCDDGENIYPIKVTNGGFKFIKFINGEQDE